MTAFVDIFANLAFVLTIISMLFLHFTVYIFWKNRNLTLIRFRWPLSYLVWVILCDLYWISRIGYLFGAIYGLYSYGESSSISITMYCLRSIGLNGSYLILLCRIWLFYYTYSYDRHMLEFRNATNSWIIRHRNKWGNERFMLCIVSLLIFIPSIFVILEETIFPQIDGFTQIYFGFSFLCLVVLAIFIPRQHDQLGLWTETVCYFISGIGAFIGLMLIQSFLDDTEKRVASYLGGTLCLFLVNLISFYITLIRYEGYKYILSINTLSTNINKNYLELAMIVTHQRTYNAFRKFLADIFCVENLDFVTIVQYYREYALNGTVSGPLIEVESVNEKVEKRQSLGIARRRKQTQEQIIDGLLVQTGNNGNKSIDITRLQLDFVQIPNDLLQLKDINKWKEWIFNHYITFESDHCLNLSSKLRKRYIKEYDSVENDIAQFYDEAQIEIWKLMAQDSMVHFRNSPLYQITMWKQDENHQ